MAGNEVFRWLWDERGTLYDDCYEADERRAIERELTAMGMHSPREDLPSIDELQRGSDAAIEWRSHWHKRPRRRRESDNPTFISCCDEELADELDEFQFRMRNARLDWIANAVTFTMAASPDFTGIVCPHCRRTFLCLITSDWPRACPSCHQSLLRVPGAPRATLDGGAWWSGSRPPDAATENGRKS